MSVQHVPILPPRARGMSAYKPASTLAEDRFVFVARPQLARVVDLEEATWLREVLEELRAMETTGRFLPGVGDLHVRTETGDRARRLLTIASVQAVPKPRLVAFSGGGIGLEWRSGGRELSFSIYPGEDEFVYTQTDEHGETEGELPQGQDDQIAAVLKAFWT
jgi:hypothetical protein